MAIANGATSLNIVDIGVLVMVARIKTFMSTGSVISPISISITTCTLNHNGSKPIASIIGEIIGTVRRESCQ